MEVGRSDHFRTFGAAVQEVVEEARCEPGAVLEDGQQISHGLD